MEIEIECNIFWKLFLFNGHLDTWSLNRFEFVNVICCAIYGALAKTLFQWNDWILRILCLSLVILKETEMSANKPVELKKG